ncbi:hypothetical protein [Egbenema bharatensis]|uniref:hypothetical protein n=1 Tax=Egbenema bharatensis TaxID=3463334 RepID=UPI003A8AE11F
MEVLLGLFISSFVAAGILSLIKGRSLVALLLLIGFIVGGGILTVICGYTALQIFSPETFESQGGGIGLLVVFFPFFLGTGLIVGAWSTAFGYWFWGRRDNVLLFQGVGLLGSSMLACLLASAIAIFFNLFTQGGSDHFTPLFLAALMGGFLSPAIAHKILYWLFG